MLTTKDNPYNPYTEYDKWLTWDQDNEYYTQEYLARIANVSPELDDETADLIVTQAVDEILENDSLGLYVVV